MFQINHLRDFEHWRIFKGLKNKEIKEHEKKFEYPPRLQIECTQLDGSKPLHSSFVVSKKKKSMESREEHIAQFPIKKGTYIVYTL